MRSPFDQTLQIYFVFINIFSEKKVRKGYIKTYFKAAVDKKTCWHNDKHRDK